MSRRKRPAGNRPSPNTTNGYPNSSLNHPEDGYVAPTVEDRAVAEAIAVLRGYGYGIAMRCLDCRRPITSSVSLARMRGPRCAARAVVK